MRFSVMKFCMNAPRNLRKSLPADHLTQLDGKKVVNGRIDYEVGGSRFYMEPVQPDWCDDRR